MTFGADVRPRLRGGSERSWDRLLTGEDLYLSARWVEVERAVSSAPVVFVSCADPPSCGTIASLLDERHAPGPFGRIDRAVQRVAGAVGVDVDPRLVSRLLPTVSVGGRRPGSSRVAVARALADPERGRALQALLSAAEQWGAAEGAASSSLLFVDADDGALRRSLAEAGYVAFPQSVASRLALPEATFDAYLASLGPSRRKTVNKERRRVHDAGVRFVARQLEPSLIDEMLPLELAVFRRYGNDFPESEARALHEAAREHLGRSVEVLAAELGGALVAFSVTIAYKSTLYGRQIGMDYDRQGSLPLYFAGMYADIAHACDRGLTHVEYGIGSHDVKRSRGFQLREQYTYVKSFDAVDQHALREVTESIATRVSSVADVAP
jgi:predicted N-acyltransferase